MLAANVHATEEVLVNVWGLGCLTGGLILVLVGARAAGLALLGSLVGSFAGFQAVSGNVDSLPYGAVAGATIGAFVAGLLGLAWTPGVSRRALNKLGSATVVAGLGAVISIGVGLTTECGGWHRWSCLPTWSPGILALFVLDAAWVAVLCFIQAAQANDESSERATS